MRSAQRSYYRSTYRFHNMFPSNTLSMQDGMIQTPTVGGRTDAILDFKGITECVKNRASTA